MDPLLKPVPTIVVMIGPEPGTPFRIPVEKISGVWALHLEVDGTVLVGAKFRECRATQHWCVTHVPTGRWPECGNWSREMAEAIWWALQRDFKWWWHDASLGDGPDAPPLPITSIVAKALADVAQSK